MARSFGLTWWGEKWLDSLTHIDFANRIPRGATYARNGSVLDVKIKDGDIKAKVAGHYSSAYNIRIKVPAFTVEEKSRLMEEVMKYPNIISKMLARELDPQLLQIAERCRIKVFPSSWKDLDMNCSCPDWAVPCKHIAAVIYKVSQEIDNNPFLVFSLHGLDFESELRSRGIRLDTNRMMDPVKLEDTYVSLEHQPTFADPRLRLATIPDIREALISILPPSPVFYGSGDFRALYAKVMLRVSKAAHRLLDGKIPTELSAIEILPTSRLHLSLNDSITPSVEMTSFAHTRRGTEKVSRTKVEFETLLSSLLQLDSESLHDYDETTEQLYKSLQTALRLMERGAVVPQIVRLSTDRVAVRWLAATINPEVETLMNQLNDNLAADLITIANGKQEPILLENRAEVLTCGWLCLLMRLYSNADQYDDVEMLFFGAQPKSFKGVGETNTPGGIKAWTDRFDLQHSAFHPVFTIHDEEEMGEDGLFGVEIAMEEAETGRRIALSDIIKEKTYEKERFSILKELSVFSSFAPRIDNYINEGALRPLAFDNADFVNFLFEAVPIIRLLQAKVIMPKSMQELIRPKVSVRLSKKTVSENSFFRLDDLLDFNWQIALGEEVVSPSDFKRMLGNALGLIRFKGQYIYASEADLEKLNKALLNPRPLTPAQMLQAALCGEYETARVQLTDEVRQLIRELTEQTNIPIPADIHAQLRPYQQRGYSWMYRNMRIGFGSIIADDMGLGKTLQVITLLMRLKHDGLLGPSAADDERVGRALVVAPTGLLFNWQQEIARFAPSLSVSIYHGAQRNLKGFQKSQTDLLLTSYGVMRSDVDKLKKMKWEMMVIDEAQNIKNQNTAQSKAIRSIPARTHIAMSGTPVENRLSEFWSIMDFANHGYLDSLKRFNEQYGTPIQKFGDEIQLRRFRLITAPFMMRRLKSDKAIISDLPDKIERNEMATLTATQAALYQQTVNEAMRTIEALTADNEPDEMGEQEGSQRKTAADNKTLFKRSALILQMMLALKQICNHPNQFLKDGKLDPSLSGKTEMLLDLLQSILSADEKVLVFTQFREMGDLLVHFIEERINQRPMFLHGGCSVKERQEMVDRFQNNRTDRIFILSLKAAGTGLNLTAATNVIHYDLWWNPAVEAQATDRAYRIGQHQNVQVYRFITQNTFEEKIDKMIQEKRHLADMTVTSGENWIGKLSNKELHEIFG